MNKALDKAATQAVTADGYEDGRSMCQRWARQVVEKVYGRQFASVMHQPSAREAALSFQKADKANPGFEVLPPSRGSVPGDLLYRLGGDGGFGHVGIRVSGNRVAENSTVHYSRTKGKTGRGFRSITEFGAYDLIVRFKEPPAK